MEEHLLIAIIAALLNILLSITIPPLLKSSNLSISEKIRQHYNCNKNVILVSTVLTILLVYISLKVTPWVKNNFLGNISSLNSVEPIIPKPLPVVATSTLPTTLPTISK